MNSNDIRENVLKYLQHIEEVNSHGKYNDSIESLYQYSVPAWFANAKLGIFIHYGLFTQSEYREWYPHRMYIPSEPSYYHHQKIMGAQTNFGYRDYIKEFKAECYDSKEWLSAIQKINARYAIITAEHHDGFPLYNSEFTEFNSYLMNPHIDFLQSMKNELNDTNIHFGISSHRAAHYWFQGAARKFGYELDSIEYGDILWPAQEGDLIYEKNEINTMFLEDWLARSCEIVDKYMPKVYYFDWWLEMEPFKPYVRKFLAYYYNKTLKYYGEEGVVTYKHATVPFGTAVKDIERGNYSLMQKEKWQGCTAMGRNSWSYTLGNEYKSPLEIIQQFIDLISKNGNMVLNIGPRKDGSISDEEYTILNVLSNWISTHSNAIFDSSTWQIFGEGETNCSEGKFSEKTLDYKKYDIRFTRKKNTIYAFIMNPQNETHFEIKAFAKQGGCFSTHGIIKSISSLTPQIDIQNYERRLSSLQIDIKESDYDLPIVFAIETE